MPSAVASRKWPALVEFSGRGWQFTMGHPREYESNFKTILTDRIGSALETWRAYRAVKISGKPEIGLKVQESAITRWTKSGYFYCPTVPVGAGTTHEFGKMGLKRTDSGFVLEKPALYAKTAETLECFNPKTVLDLSFDEPRIPIPDVNDRLINTPHVGHGQGGYATMDAMKIEGDTDAECTIDYLNRYNKLFAQPSAQYYYDVIGRARDSDPFFNTMRYLENGNYVSMEFITLLHVGYPLAQVMAHQPHNADYWFLAEILKAFCQDNYSARHS